MSSVILLVLWLICGIVNIIVPKVSKASYICTWLVLMVCLLQDAMPYIQSLYK